MIGPGVLVLGALVVLAACGGGGTAAPDPDVRGGWQLVSGSSRGTPIPQPSGVRATLVFDDEQLSGRSFCNRYATGYRLDGGALTVDGLGATEMGCAPDVMAAETAYLTALGKADRAALDGADLVLTGTDVALRFAKQPPVPDRDLAGTRWVLDTLIDGEVASSVAGEATLQLAADGTASGTTGCRTWTGTWRLDGDTLALGIVQEDVACPPELGRQDEQVLAVTTAAPIAGVVGDRLTLTAPDGRGLVYRAG